jgi:hypothetical protein
MEGESMATQFKLEDLVGIIQKAAQPGLLTQFLSKDHGIPKSISEFLKSTDEQPPQASESRSGQQAAGASSSRSSIINGVLSALGRVTSSPFAEIARENMGNNVLITTSQEILEGVVAEVGHWYVVLTEDGGSSVTVNLHNVQAFQPSGVEVEPE